MQLKDLKHLKHLMPSFTEEIQKEAGLKEFKAGATKALSALKKAPKKAGEVATSALVRARSHPTVGKAIEMATDPLNSPDVGHAVTNLSRMLGH